MHSADVPPHSAAFDHPETRAAWQRTRNRIRGRFWLWTALFVALLALSIVLNASAETDYARRGSNQLGPAIGGLAILWYPFVLYSCLGALSRLKKARTVLEACPWQVLPATRKASGKEGTGVLVHLGLPGGAASERPGAGERVSKGSTPGVGGAVTASALDGAGVAGDVQWSPTMSARDPRRWNRWDERLERGAWFAGDPSKWGVLALPGGSELMTVHRSTANLSADRTSAQQDLKSVLAEARRG